MPCRSPQNYPWISAVLDKGYQMLFLDQRGTGLSSTVTSKTLAREGGPRKQAEYLKHFRADSIGTSANNARDLCEVVDLTSRQ